MNIKQACMWVLGGCMAVLVVGVLSGAVLAYLWFTAP